jgi:hypothetical protein
MRWWEKRQVVFTRSRPYWKNDNCHVEQKNGHVVRRFVGHARYDTEQALAVLAELERKVALFVDFFKPTQKLVQKVRQGTKVKRVYDTPKTPCQRLCEDPTVPEEVKQALRRQFATLMGAGQPEGRSVRLCRRARGGERSEALPRGAWGFGGHKRAGGRLFGRASPPREKPGL